MLPTQHRAGRLGTVRTAAPLTCESLVGVSRPSVIEMFDRQNQNLGDGLVLDSPLDECVLAIDQIDEWGTAFISLSTKRASGTRSA